MHDGGSGHRAHIVTNLLQDIIQRLDVTIMIWPRYSPNLNPIENLWALTKAEIYRLHPESEHAPDSEETEETLVEAANEAWRKI
jgi:transposase